MYTETKGRKSVLKTVLELVYFLSGELGIFSFFHGDKKMIFPFEHEETRFQTLISDI